MTIDKLNSISFSGKMASAYLEKKAAQRAKLAEETIKEQARMLINQNRAASRSHQYIPGSAYFGHVGSTDFSVGMQSRINSAAKEYASVARASEQTSQTKHLVSDPHFFG